MKLLAVSLLSLPLVLGRVAPAQSANPQHVERLLKTNQCPMCDLSEANLAETNLFGANLVGANLQGADLSGANLGAANLSDANLSRARLQRTYLYEATLENTNLSQADLTGAYLKQAALSAVDFTGTKLQGTNLSRANLVGISLRNLDLRQANLSGALLTGVKVPEDIGLYNQLPGQIRTSLCERDRAPTEAELTSARQAGFELSFADLRDSDLQGANLRGAVLVNGDLRGANLTAADLSYACVNLANLSGARLDRARLKYTRLDAAILENTSLKDVEAADLSRTYKSGAEARRVPIEQSAQQHLQTLIRAQQAYYLEQGQFARDLNALTLGETPDQEHYHYQIVINPAKPGQIMLGANPKAAELTTFVGLMALPEAANPQETMPTVTLCRSQQLRQPLPKVADLILSATAIACPPQYQPITAP
jgi:uncharacterized protein YjbI with pentapeptide repeats